MYYWSGKLHLFMYRLNEFQVYSKSFDIYYEVFQVNYGSSLEGIIWR